MKLTEVLGLLAAGTAGGIFSTVVSIASLVTYPVLLALGVPPLAANMTKGADEHNEYLQVMRVLILAFLKGQAPMIAIEMARRAIPAHVRPTFDEMEKACKGGGASAAPEAAAAA